MKKTILLIALSITSITKAQFITSGNNLVHSANNTTLRIISESNSNGTHISSGQSLNLIFNDNNAGTDFFSIRANNSTLSSSTEFFRINHIGNIGIGTSNPSQKLEVKGTVLSDKIISRSTMSLYSTEENKTRRRLTFNTDDGDNNYIYNYDQVNSSFHTINIGGSHSLSSGLTILGNGNIGIQTPNPGSWKLAVNGKIRAKEIKVETGWSDFVFFDNYKLPTLQEVENHIKENGHLKDIPSAKDVEENGIFLGEMDSKLLQKIEELTLYTIQQEKKIRELESLNKKLLELQLRLEKLESEK